MTPYNRRMYRREIAELTILLRHHPEWEELRSVLSRRGIRPSETLLAAFMEARSWRIGDGMEYGGVVMADGGVIEYHRRISLHRSGPQVLVWRDRTDDPEMAREYPQVAVALEMLDPGRRGPPERQ